MAGLTSSARPGANGIIRGGLHNPKARSTMVSGMRSGRPKAGAKDAVRFADLQLVVTIELGCTY